MSNQTLGSAHFQNQFGCLRVIFFLFILMFFCCNGPYLFQGVVLQEIMESNRQAQPILTLLPEFFQAMIALIFSPVGYRFMITPLLAMLCVLIAGAYYVKDIYALPNYGTAFQYVVASMFAGDYPELTIEGGEPILQKNEVNLIDRIGGPGFVIVQPGSAAVFRHLREISEPVVSAVHFVAPFERVAQAVSLEEQQGDRDAIPAMTRDGILVRLCDVHFRYRIRHRVENGRPVLRTPEQPNPFDLTALTSMLANLSVQEDGKQERWIAAIERAVTGTITDFVASKTIDYLTAPCRDGSNPRQAMQAAILPEARRSLNGLGAELLWIDPGHLEIDFQEVGEQRTSLWAARWIGNSNVTRSYSESLRQAYRELGRAQAQAEIIMSIADALSSSNLSDHSAENVRRILLARTAQVIDSLSSDNPEKK
jgi:hypothetical protein